MRTTTTATTSGLSMPTAAPPGDTGLTGDVLVKVKAIALDELPGGTVVGIDFDADDGAYVAHMLNADGTPMTVYIDASFDFVGLS